LWCNDEVFAHDAADEEAFGGDGGHPEHPEENAAWASAGLCIKGAAASTNTSLRSTRQDV